MKKTKIWGDMQAHHSLAHPSQHRVLSDCDFMLLNISALIFHDRNCQLNCYGSLRRGSTRCSAMHWYILQAQVQFLLQGTQFIVRLHCALQHWCRDRVVNRSASSLLTAGLMYKKKLG